jgi:hypothetical protein
MGKLGAFVGGFGTGFMSMQKMKLDSERADREKASFDLQQQVQQRALDKDVKLQAAYQDIANEAVKRSGVQIPQSGNEDPADTPHQPSAQQTLGFALHAAPDLFKDRDFLNTAASAFLTRGLPDGVKWLEAGHAASQEGYTGALKALMNGDIEGAAQQFNSSGRMKVDPKNIVPVEGKEGVYSITGSNGKTMTVDAKQSYINLLPPKDFAHVTLMRPYYDALAKKANEASDTALEGRRISADARVGAAEVGADSRVEAAGIRAGGAVDAAGVRAAGRGAGSRGGGAGGTLMYGGDKGAAKWIDDFEKHYIPKRDVTDESGTRKFDANGKPMQEVDADAAPMVRDLARVNHEVLASGGIHPQEASNVFTQFAKAYKTGDRAKMFAELDKAGRVAIVENENGDPVKAVGSMGQYKDARGQTRRMFFELPDDMSTELITQEAINRGEKGKRYPDEGKRGAANNVSPAAKAGVMRAPPEAEQGEQAPDPVLARSLDSAKDAVKSMGSELRAARNRLLGYGLTQRRADPVGFKRAQSDVANAENELAAAGRAVDEAQRRYEASFGSVPAAFARRGVLVQPPRPDVATVE